MCITYNIIAFYAQKYNWRRQKPPFCTSDPDIRLFPFRIGKNKLLPCFERECRQEKDVEFTQRYPHFSSPGPVPAKKSGKDCGKQENISTISSIVLSGMPDHPGFRA